MRKQKKFFAAKKFFKKVQKKSGKPLPRARLEALGKENAEKPI
jgi:hypothetical protein